MDKKLQELKQRILSGMISYMEGDEGEGADPIDAPYTREQVARCGEILDRYLTAVGQTPESGRDAYILQAVKQAVLDLNVLNDACDGSLIETDQREEICELVIEAAKRAGLVSEQYDITEEWRDW